MTATLGVDTISGALRELEQAFPGAVTHEPDGAGGVYATVAACWLGNHWSQPVADLSFHIPFNYPWAAIYPYYLPGETWPATAASPALQDISWRGQQVIQVSLRHSQWNPQIDTALGCVRQVLEWARNLR